MIQVVDIIVVVGGGRGCVIGVAFAAVFIVGRVSVVVVIVVG